jgi:hypothetical protein
MDLKKVLGVGAVFAMGFALTVAGPAQGEPADTTTDATDTATIYVPSDFDAEWSDTRATGFYEVVDSGLHIWTGDERSTNKVAEYVDENVLLADVGEPSLDYVGTGTAPGFQLVVDFDANGTRDAILVGETIYGNDWWVWKGAPEFVRYAAPSQTLPITGDTGSAYHGTLDQWRTAFPDAVVQAFGFALGSGVDGDWMLNSINFDGVQYRFANSVVLDGKNECKSGGWAASMIPVFRNQGDCVSYFASAKK